MEKSVQDPSISALELHDALELGSVEGVNDGLPLRDLQLALPVGESGGDRRRIGEVLVVAKPVDGPPPHVFSHVVVAELACRA